jgi:hypothetical protein
VNKGGVDVHLRRQSLSLMDGDCDAISCDEVSVGPRHLILAPIPFPAWHLFLHELDSAPSGCRRRDDLGSAPSGRRRRVHAAVVSTCVVRIVMYLCQPVDNRGRDGCVSALEKRKVLRNQIMTHVHRSMFSCRKSPLFLNFRQKRRTEFHRRMEGASLRNNLEKKL